MSDDYVELQSSVNKMLWVGVVNQGTYSNTSVNDLHNNVHRRQHYHTRCKP